MAAWARRRAPKRGPGCITVISAAGPLQNVMLLGVDMPPDLRGMLEPGERVLWVGRPVRAVAALTSLPILLFAAPFILIPVLALPGPAWTQPVVQVFFAFWYALTLPIAFLPLYAYLAAGKTWYLLSDRRIVVRKGVIGTDYDVLGLDKVQQVNVNVGLVDKFYGTGSIKVQAIGVEPLTLQAVKEPYKVQKLILKALEEARRAASLTQP